MTRFQGLYRRIIFPVKKCNFWSNLTQKSRIEFCDNTNNSSSMYNLTILQKYHFYCNSIAKYLHKVVEIYSTMKQTIIPLQFVPKAIVGFSLSMSV